MKSIQTRLVIGLLISLILVFLSLWIIVSQNIQNLSEQYISTRLEHDIENLVTAITFDNDNNILVNEQYINPIYKRPFSGHYFQIRYNQTSIRSRSLWDQSLNTPTIIDNNYQSSHQTGPENQSLILMSKVFIKQNKNITISIAEDLTPITRAIEKFKNYFSLLSVIILIILLFTQVIVLRSGLRPLRKISTELNQLEKGEITQLSSNVPTELNAVVNEINQLSQALHKRLKRSRDALSDLSHSIKKPLTILQQFSDQTTELSNDSKATLNKQIDSIQATTDHILKRARIAGGSQPGQYYNLNSDLQLLIKTVQSIYPQKIINIKTKISNDLQVQVDREDMLELIGNLLDNALKWANSKILITATQNQQLHITIEDDGDGHQAESLNELMNRGIRLDETVSGYGFGLAISSDIVKDYEGTLVFNRSETLGGFKAEISIPTIKK